MKTKTTESTIEVLGALPRKKIRRRLPSARKMRAAAKELYEREGELEIDEDAIISRGEDNEAEGAYVAAWVWVYDADAKDTKLKEAVFKRRMGHGFQVCGA